MFRLLPLNGDNMKQFTLLLNMFRLLPLNGHTMKQLTENSKDEKDSKMSCCSGCFICVYCLYYTLKWIWKHNMKRIVGLFFVICHPVIVALFVGTNLLELAAGVLTYRKCHCLWQYGVLRYPSTYNVCKVITPVTITITIFWDVTLCSTVEIHWF
jgi:hypothetical protein